MPAKKGASKKSSAKAAPKDESPASEEPHEINSALASPRMKALLEDHRKMGSRP
jgi:hypothetical protein